MILLFNALLFLYLSNAYDLLISAIILTKDNTARSAICLTLFVYASYKFFFYLLSLCLRSFSVYFHTNKKASPMFLLGEPQCPFTTLWQIYAI